MKVLFTMAFLLGVVISSLNSDYHVTRMGNVLIMIAVFGGLLLVGKRIGRFKPERNAIRLGLNE